MTASRSDVNRKMSDMSTFDEKPKRGTSYELAPVSTRFIALVIDSMVLGLITGLLVGATRNAGGGVAGFLIGVAYHWYFLTQQDGQTPGKRIMNIRVIKVSGVPLTGTDVVIRYIGYYINSALMMLGWIWAMFDADSQGLHDKLAGTYVVMA